MRSSSAAFGSARRWRCSARSWPTASCCWRRQLRFSHELGESRVVPDQPSSDRTLETGGYRFSPATVTSLGQIDLFRAPPPRGPVFVAAQNRLVTAYAKQLATGPAPVRSTDFPGFQNLFPDPATNLPPIIVFRRAVDWMTDTFGSEPRRRPPADAF